MHLARRNRRRFIMALGGAAIAWPIAARAQSPERMFRIGFLGAVAADGYGNLLDAFRQGLRDLGYVEGKNLVIEYRWADGKYERLPQLAADLVSVGVSVIVTHGTPGSLAAKRATNIVPIVMAVSGDAVATGLIQSITRPGENITGSTFFFPELNAKRLEFLKVAMPLIRRVGVLMNPDNPAHASALSAMAVMAKSVQLEIHPFAVKEPRELASVFSEIAQRRMEAVEVIDDRILIVSGPTIARLAITHKLPVIGGREVIEDGGLMAYAVDFAPMYRRAASFVDKILKGANPADLPVEQATKFELVVNLKTAKVLDIDIPLSILLRADEVIE